MCLPQWLQANGVRKSFVFLFTIALGIFIIGGYVAGQTTTTKGQKARSSTRAAHNQAVGTQGKSVSNDPIVTVSPEVVRSGQEYRLGVAFEEKVSKNTVVDLKFIHVNDKGKTTGEYESNIVVSKGFPSHEIKLTAYTKKPEIVLIKASYKDKSHVPREGFTFIQVLPRNVSTDTPLYQYEYRDKISELINKKFSVLPSTLNYELVNGLFQASPSTGNIRYIPVSITAFDSLGKPIDSTKDYSAGSAIQTIYCTITLQHEVLPTDSPLLNLEYKVDGKTVDPRPTKNGVLEGPPSTQVEERDQVITFPITIKKIGQKHKIKIIARYIISPIPSSLPILSSNKGIRERDIEETDDSARGERTRKISLHFTVTN